MVEPLRITFFLNYTLPGEATSCATPYSMYRTTHYNTAYAQLTNRKSLTSGPDYGVWPYCWVSAESLLRDCFFCFYFGKVLVCSCFVQVQGNNFCH